ncbi:MAG TPA: hypothetical protein VF794_10115 [Archangium sp.]|uniref:hypothetical protein n=1 Tax=Archangium sp. TaxID=1872627 RepID=UPI002ED8A2A8
MSISSVRSGAANLFGGLSKLGAGSQTASLKGKVDSLIADIGEKLKAGDTQGLAESFKKLLDTLGVKNADKILEALGLGGKGKKGKGGEAAGGAPAGAEGAGGGGAPEGAGGAEAAGGAGGAEGAGGAPQAGGAEGAGGVLELLMKLAQENPELAKQLAENPELLKQLAENPELLKQLSENPQQLQQVLKGAQAGLPMEFSGVSQFEAAPAAGPVSLG